MSGALVLRAGALGDVLLLRRAVFALRRSGRAVALLAPRESGSALVGAGPCDASRLVPWDRPEMASLLAKDFRLPAALRKDFEGFELVVAYTRNADLALSLRALVETVIVHDPQPRPGCGHASVQLASALGPLGLEVAGDPAPCLPTPEERERARPWLERLPPRFLAVHPGSGSPSKNWPAASFSALIEALQPDEAWLLIEGPADRACASQLRLLPGAVVADGLAPRTLGATLSSAGVYVGNDSGVSHLAAAWGAPTVALFGPTDPDVWAPVGPQVHVVRASGSSMADISVELVVAATRRMWARA